MSTHTRTYTLELNGLILRPRGRCALRSQDLSLISFVCSIGHWTFKTLLQDQNEKKDRKFCYFCLWSGESTKFDDFFFWEKQKQKYDKFCNRNILSIHIQHLRWFHKWGREYRGIKFLTGTEMTKVSHWKGCCIKLL